LAHRDVQTCMISDWIKIVAIRLVLREADDLSMAEFAEQGDISLANCRAQISFARQGFSLRQQIRCTLIWFEPFAQNNSRFAFCFLLATAAYQPRPVSPDQQRNRGYANSYDENLGEH